MKVPSNKVKTGKYTPGGEFVEETTNKAYQGYYYELNNSLYAGREFKAGAPKIIRVQEANKLYYNNFDTAIFSLISGITSQQLSSPKVAGITNTSGSPIRYFAKKLNTNPILIKEIDKNTYNSLQKDPTYQTIIINLPSGDNPNSKVIDNADKQMPGLKSFILSSFPSNERS